MLTIKQRQLNLRTHCAYYNGSVDGIEGKGTKSAYRGFQRDNGLVADGIYGVNTDNKLVEVIRNLQRLLNNHGYKLAVDGIVGNATINALKDFQSKHGLVVDGIAGVKTYAKLNGVSNNLGNTNVNSYTCKHFKKSEFACKCGCGKNNIEPQTEMIGDKIRDHFGRPAIITSGCRCETHNKRVGGVPNSRHLQGKAIDIIVSGVSGTELLKYCRTLVNIGEARYTYYISGNACHIDIN